MATNAKLRSRKSTRLCFRLCVLQLFPSTILRETPMRRRPMKGAERENSTHRVLHRATEDSALEEAATSKKGVVHFWERMKLAA
eukprot:7159003-Pyramimonas_sp.AAC.1